MLVITSYCSKVLKNLKFSTIDTGAFLVILLLKIAFNIYPTFDENALYLLVYCIALSLLIACLAYSLIRSKLGFEI